MRSAVVVVVVALSALAACERAPSSPGGPTYHADIAPLIQNNCASCHQAGGIAPFPLVTYEDAFDNKEAIAVAVADRRMPPWNLDNTGACKTYRDARWLDDDEIAVFTDWVEAGAPEGVRPGQALTPPEPDRLDDDNAVYLEMDEPYTPTPQPDNPGDDYRCFFLEPGNTADAFVTGFEIVPGAPQEVHHMLLFSLLENSAELQAQALDDEDESPGWTCFGAAGDGIDEADILLLAGWAPGTNVKRYPAGTGIFVPANRRMVMQIHYNLLAGAVPDLTGIKVALAPSVDKQAMLLPLADDSFELPPNEPLVRFGFTQSLFGLTEPLEVHGVFPHMHQMGQTLRVTKGRIGDTDSSDAECLADVPRWDFSWQEVAFYDEPVLVDGSNQIDVTCTWDTSNRTTPTFWGEGTTDEMCLAFVYATRTNGGPVSDLL